MSRIGCGLGMGNESENEKGDVYSGTICRGRQRTLQTAPCSGAFSVVPEQNGQPFPQTRKRSTARNDRSQPVRPVAGLFHHRVANDGLRGARQRGAQCGHDAPLSRRATKIVYHKITPFPTNWAAPAADDGRRPEIEPHSADHDLELQADESSHVSRWTVV